MHRINRPKRRHLTAVYSSPLERAMETAAPIALLAGLPVRTSEAFAEIQFGEWTGRTLDELSNISEWRRFNTQRSVMRIPGGELMLEVQARVLTEMETMRARHPDGYVAIVSHMDVIKAAIAHFAGIHLDLLFRFEIAPASVSVVEMNEYGPRIVSLNDMGDDA